MARRLVRPERRNLPGDPSLLALARPSTRLHPPAGSPRDPAERPAEPLTRSRNPPRAQGGLEREVISLRTSLQRKDQDLDAAAKENRELRAELRAARERGDRRASSPDPSDDDDFRLDDALALLRESEVRLAASREECAALKRFLADYGMKWVGDGEAQPDRSRSGSGSGSGSGSSEDGPPRAARKVRSNRLEARAAAARAKSSSPDHASGGFAVDVARLRRSIRELNAVAGEGKGAVVTAPNGDRRVEMPTPMTLTLWRDGFAVEDGDFRGFEEEKNRAFVRDLVDGYFPYEFKDTHPEGVPFRLIDKSDERRDAGFRAFTGEAVRLDGGEARPGEARGAAPAGPKPKPPANPAPRPNAAGAVIKPKPKTRAFLDKLPPTVIRAGKVVEVRAGVEAMLRGGDRDRGGDAGRTVLETTVSRECFRRLAEEDAAKTRVGDRDDDETRRDSGASVKPLEPSASLATLRVKGVDGHKMYVVKLRGEDTVGKLRGYLERAVASDGSNASRFEIRNAYPPRTFDDDAMTLEDAGLTPNATLLLRPIR